MEAAVCNPLLRTPLSIIVDDSCPVINLAYYWMKQRHAWKARHEPGVAPDRWEGDPARVDKLPHGIPADFARKWGDWCAEAGVFFEAFLQPGKDGKLKLPLSGSPEIHNNELAAWLTPNSNFDLALLRWLFAALAEMAEAAGEAAQAPRWRNLLDRLDDLAVEGSQSWDGSTHGALRLSPDESLKETHRHHSHLIAQ